MARNIFSRNAKKKVNRSVFDLSHDKKLSFNMGELVPILCQEVVPGDTFRVRTENMIRFAPMLAPIMHRVNVYTHYFFVPNRLIWDNWETFITGGPDGKQTPVAPYFSATLPTIREQINKPGTLADYLGVPPIKDNELGQFKISSLPFRAYQLIYNDYYRDQNLTDPVEIYTGDGLGSDDPTSLFTIRKRAWEKDYFTSALPWTQRGGDVTLPMSGNAPVKYSGNVSVPISTNTSWSSTGPDDHLQFQGPSGKKVLAQAQSNTSQPVTYIDPGSTLVADMTNVTASTINDLRRANRLQEFLENNARGGARYTEQILSHFGVRSSDARLQRPEYLGGGKQSVKISEVLQTSATQADSPLAEMAGHGISVGQTNEFNKFFEEHGFIIGILSVLPRTSYQQGLPRTFSRFDKFDYYWPEFAHLGEQAVLNKEIYIHGSDAQRDEVFGYQSRYAEYKYSPGTVHGDFRTNLSFWHMGRIFENSPSLNSQFVESDPTSRIFSVTDSSVDHLYSVIYHDIKAIRPMPKYGTPYL